MAAKAKKNVAIAETVTSSRKQTTPPSARRVGRVVKVAVVGSELLEPIGEDNQAEPVGGALADNLFAELGMPNADERYLKSLLSERIAEALDAQGLTQSAAAEKMGMAQPDVSAILRGRFKNYSVFRLLKALAALGYDIEIAPRARDARSPGNVMIVS